ncbi:repressor [Caballeronia jiangsuensis]|nr:repressor [Caballeronia jiangsuensis]
MDRQDEVMAAANTMDADAGGTSAKGIAPRTAESIDFNKQWLRVVSDSMFNPADPNDSFSIGDLLQIDLNREALNGDAVIVESGDAMTLMGLVVEGGRRLLKYLNPAWTDVIELDDSLMIAGVVAFKVTRLRLGLYS